MSVLEKLAASQGIHNDLPNQQLAREIVAKKDRTAIKELAENLTHNDKRIQSNCIKVLYEVGEQQRALIADYDKEFLALLDSKNNRLVWGAMTALDCITAINPKSIYKHLAKILDVAEKGSVITKDHGMGILTKLAALPQYSDEALTLLIDQLKTSATNQLPKYAEDALPVMTAKHKHNFSKVLSSRLKEVESDSKRKRIERVLKRLK